MKRTTPRSGFTLFELVLAMAGTIILLGVLFEAHQRTLALSNASIALGGLDETAGRVAMQISRELRWADADTLLVTAENGTTRIDLLMATGVEAGATCWSTPITIRYEPLPADLNENGLADEGQLVRIQDGQRRVLCKNMPVGGLQLLQNGNRLDLSVTVSRLIESEEVTRTVETSLTLINGGDA